MRSRRRQYLHNTAITLPGRRPAGRMIHHRSTSVRSYRASARRPQHHPRNSSWDLLGGARKFGQAYEHFDSRNASEQHLVFADGDLPNFKFVRFYQISFERIGRPVLAIVWILELSVSRPSRGERFDCFHTGFRVHSRLYRYNMGRVNRMGWYEICHFVRIQLLLPVVSHAT